MRWPIGSSRSPIGVDVGSRQIRAAQLFRTSRGWRVEALTSMARKNPDGAIDRQEAAYLRDVLKRQGFRGAEVVLAVPEAQLLTGVLELPAAGSGAPLKEIASVEISRMYDRQPGSLEVSYWPLPPTAQSKGTCQAMAVAYPHADADELLNVFDSTGLNVEVIDVHAKAVARACDPALAPVPSSTAILIVDWTSAVLAIVTCGVITYQRVLGEAGMGKLTESIKSKYGLDAEAAIQILRETDMTPQDGGSEGSQRGVGSVTKLVTRHCDAIVDELRAPLVYVGHQYPGSNVAKLLLTGEMEIPGFCGYLAAALGMEAAAIAPVHIADCPAATLPRAQDTALTPAVGLAAFQGGQQIER